MNKINIERVRKILKEIFNDEDRRLQFFIDLFLLLFLCTKTGMGKYFVLEALFLGGFIILLGYKIIKNKEKIEITKYNIWYIVFTIFACLSYFWAMSKEYALKIFPSILALSIFGLAITNYIKNKGDFEKILKLYVIANLYAAIKILLFYWFEKGTAANRIINITGIYFNTVAQVMAFSVIIVAYLGINSKNKGYIIIAIIQMIVIYMSESRKALLMPIVGILIILLLKKKAKKEIISYACISIVAILTIICAVQLNTGLRDEFDSLMKSVILRQETNDYSINLRSFLRETAVDLFYQKPILGAGINNFAYYVKNYTSYTEDRYAHNNYVELLSCVGIVGTVLYYWLYGYILIKLLRKIIKDRSIKNIFAFALIIVLAIFEWGIVSYSGCLYNLIIFMSHSIADKEEKE